MMQNGRTTVSDGAAAGVLRLAGADDSDLGPVLLRLALQDNPPRGGAGLLAELRDAAERGDLRAARAETSRPVAPRWA